VVSRYLLVSFLKGEQVFLSFVTSFDFSYYADFADDDYSGLAAKLCLLQSEGLRESGVDPCGPFLFEACMRACRFKHCEPTDGNGTHATRKAVWCPADFFMRQMRNTIRGVPIWVMAHHRSALYDTVRSVVFSSPVETTSSATPLVFSNARTLPGPCTGHAAIPIGRSSGSAPHSR
jgi:hypothetical protein